MVQSKPVSSVAVGLTTKAGTYSFTTRDRLWVQGDTGRESRPVTEVRPGDLVAFLGRVLSVRFVTEGSGLAGEKAAQEGDSQTLPSIAA
jgi:hypothetical protein